LQLLDIGGDMHAFDGRKLRHAARVKPVEEFDRRARIGAARVRVANVGSEEFEEAIGGASSRTFFDNRAQCYARKSNDGAARYSLKKGKRKKPPRKS